MAADPVFAQWLMSQSLSAVGVNATINNRWGATAQATERQTNIATRADAEAEAARQLQFIGGPLVEEKHQLVGDWSEYIGQVVNLTIDELGYGAGLDVFVIGVEVDRATGISFASVLRRL